MTLKHQTPLLIEVSGDQSHLQLDEVDVVEVRTQDGRTYTILSVPSGTLSLAAMSELSFAYRFPL